MVNLEETLGEEGELLGPIGRPENKTGLRFITEGDWFAKVFPIIEEFSGRNPEINFRKLQTRAAAENWDPSFLVKLIKSKLKGEAEYYEKFKKLFINRFGTVTSAHDALCELQSLAQRSGESVKEFGDRVNGAALRWMEAELGNRRSEDSLDLVRKTALSTFTKGLRPEIRKGTRLLFSTAEDELDLERAIEVADREE